MKRLINITLLFVFSFSISHGMILDIHQENHCSIQTYIDEFSHPIDHKGEHKGDLCQTHCLLHISFIVPSIFTLAMFDYPFINLKKEYLYYNCLDIKNNFRPPIFIFS